MPTNKDYVFKGERSIAYLLGFVLNAYHPEGGFKSPKEIAISFAFLVPL